MAQQRLFPLLLLTIVLSAKSEVIQEFEISEGVQIGTSVGFIGKPVAGSSHPPPPPPYLIVPSPGSAVDSDLTIDQSNGEILTRIQLDRETRDSYSLVAIPITGENIRVIIRVRDENDHAPEFPSSFMHVEFPENTPRDVKRTLQPARDKDLGIYNTQRYVISAGNVNNAFRLSSHRERDGVLYLDLQVNGFLDRETTPGYSLLIEAFDGGVPPLKGSMTINITITDQNDNAPQFSKWQFPRVSSQETSTSDSDDITFNQSRYFAVIPENATVGTSVLQVFATDIDEGSNGQVSYSINRRQTDKDSVFRIDRSTGMIYVNGPLDYETKEAYELVVIARDSGIQPLETTVFVTIRVLDLNDNQMEINVSFFSGDGDDSPPRVSEKALPGEFVARISIIDPDSKQEYNNVSISLEGGDGFFGLETVNSAVYLVVGSKKLDREIKPSVTLTVVVKDKGNPYLNASNKFAIQVEDDNDNSPIFEVEEYHASVLETAEPNSVVVQVKANDEDFGENARITYELIPSPETHSNWFDINQSTGVITTKSHIDCEIDPTPILTVLAKDHGKPALTGSATVVVHLIDNNDAPIFNQGFYNTSVLETAPYGTCLLKVSATDPDCGINAELSYNLLETVPSGLPFSVNPKSGEICVSGPLDYEKKTAYHFLVSASDTGGLSSATVVNIQLIDENDNVPSFYSRSFSVTVKEGSIPSTPIVAVAATDKDSSKFGKLTYSFVEGNEDGLFPIDKNTGEISMPRTSFKGRKTYRLYVTARDGDNRLADENAEVTIHVFSADVKAPIFQKPRYQFTVPEDLNVQSSVGSVSASGSGRVRYSILSGDPKSHFTIDQYTGNIKIASKLDHEETPHFLLSIQAKIDQHEVISYCQVEIKVSDTNDNYPQFESKVVKIWIPETTEVGSTVYVAWADDRDEGQNGDVTYTLVQNPFGMFKIDKFNGLLTLQKTLDYETMKEFAIVIKARDGGNPPKSSDSLTVNVEVQDSNDNSPIWFKKRHEFFVKEKSPSGTFVGRLTRQDKNQNGAIKFQIQPPTDGFQIDSDSGIISTTQPLFRNQSHHELTVIAFNQAPFLIKAEFDVHVQILEINSRIKMPMSTSDESSSGIMQYHINVAESLPINVEIAQVIALDEDSGNNARIRYKIEESPLQDIVGIFSSTGAVYLKSILDREVQDEYIVKIIATDHGVPSLSSTATMHLKVLDENDNAPIFEKQLFKFSLRENNDPGVVIGHITAHDRDSGNNSAIRYFFQPQNPDFNIDEMTGTITATSSLDREKQTMHELQAVAIDNGIPPRQSEAIIQVIVTDDNDNEPQILEPDQDSIIIREHLPVGTEVARIMAIDADEGNNAKISYILFNDYFTIDENSGAVKTKRVLSRSTKTFYNFQIRARDHGTVAKESVRDYRVEVLDVGDKRSEALFVPSKLRFKVYENSTIGYTIGKININAEDSEGKPQVFYRILSSSPQDSFEIHGTNGAIVVSDKLNYEQVSQYMLKVKVSMQTLTSFREATVAVEINVLDVNDERAKFPQDPIAFSVSESTPVGTSVWNFTAEDKDSGLNGILHYSITHQEPQEKFRINMLTGTLTLQSPLDYEICSSYVLIITATDQAVQVEDRLNSSVTVKIIIEDENDNVPLFSSPSSIEIYELEPLRSAFHTVIAKDIDSLKYGEVSYRIVSGNNEGIFKLNGQNGRLSLAKPLKKDVKRYSLNISAFDHGVPANVVSQILAISVKADKNHAPRFLEAKYEANVLENSATGTHILKVMASKESSSSDYKASNNSLKYIIPQGLGDGKFAIHPTTGSITVAGSIDRELQAEYSFTVYVQDDKQIYVYDSTLVYIHVMDENDFAPDFHDSCVDLTVPENNELGVIHIFTAEDPDVGKNGDITFAITGGNAENMFNVDLHTGKLTGRPLDRERRSHYNLIIVAQDQGSPSRKTSCNMTITVDDENDSPIIFVSPTKSEEQMLLQSVSHSSFQKSHTGQAVYSASIPENVPIGTAVLKVAANDADIGVNSIITYSLNNESHWHFTIDNSTGAILTAGMLDREKISNYIFEVAATDGGLYDSRSSTASVHLTVLDYNDNRPMFMENPLKIEIPTNTKAGQNIAQVVASDADEGTNAEITYSLDSNEFAVNPQTGQISVMSSLTSDNGKIFHLKVVATDHGVPSLSSTALVSVQIGSVDFLSSLKFQESIYKATLLENSETGTEVIKVSALRNDGRRGRISYDIVGGNEDGAFDIVSTSGVIRVKDPKRLDKEQQSQFKLVVAGKSDGSSPQFTHSVVQITLLDANDNIPRFTQESYIASVWEGNTKGTFVTQVMATDADEGPNANVVYHIIDGNQDNAFMIEPPFSGIVKTNIVLDREILDEYRLTIIATDEGSPQMTGTCYLQVNVIDIQDQSPVFPPHSVIAVKEDSPVGTLITTMVANDVDTNPTLVYGFTEQGNPEGMFSIGKYTGRVTLVKPLDFDLVKTHTAKVQVSDSVHIAYTTLTVNVLDANNHRPSFSKDVYRIVISEGTKIGTKAGQVNASDKDSNENGMIKYSLRYPNGANKASPKFLRVDEDSGNIFVTSAIVYKRDHPFTQIIVVATDKGKPSKSSESTLWVEIRPSQSHILKFSQSKYRSTINQNIKPGSIITQLLVERGDQLSKGLHYHFSIVSGNEADHFAVNSHNGQVVVAKALDKDSSPSLYTLVISADCIDMEQCNSFAELSIEVSPVTQFGPMFDKIFHRISISEGKQVGSTLLKLHATDSKSNGSIKYEITSGNERNLVELNPDSGVLVLKKNLDFDQSNNNYHLVVRAVNQDRSPPSWNFTMIDITVEDDNDHEPKFLFSNYVGIIGENEPIGTIVCTVKATDLDKGIYGKLQYSILDGDGKDKFLISSSSGVVTSNTVFDYESKSRYYVTVRASDISGKSCTTRLQIEVESKDEFSPQFIQKNYRFNVPRNAEPGHVIGRVEAVDQDRGPDGLLIYHLASPNSNFAVNSSNGFIILNTEPNININTTLTIQASSGRSGSKHSVTNVEVLLGEALKELEVAASSTTDWVLGILVTTLLLLFLACAVFLLLHMRNKRESKKGKSEEFNTPNFDTLDYAPTTLRIGSTKQDSIYGSHYGNIMDLRNNDRRRMNNTISEISDQSNSASSGRGSAEDGEEVEEDEEICMINEGTLAHQQLQGMHDEDDDDNVSQNSAKNTQEYLERLGIRPNISEDHSIQNDWGLSHNSDNLHEKDISALIYSQISEDLNHSVLDKSNGTYRKNVPQPSVSGSLSSIVHNEEELAGTYNWDYLLDWNPQYQPLAHVFSEIAHLKEGSNRSEPTYCGILSNNISSNSSDKGSSSHHNFEGSVVSSSSRGVPRTGPLPPLPTRSIRSPISNDMSFASGPISPSFSPALSPLANRSPSISPLGNVAPNNIRTSQMHDNYRSDSELRM